MKHNYLRLITSSLAFLIALIVLSFLIITLESHGHTRAHDSLSNHNSTQSTAPDMTVGERRANTWNSNISSTRNDFDGLKYLLGIATFETKSSKPENGEAANTTKTPGKTDPKTTEGMVNAVAGYKIYINRTKIAGGNTSSYGEETTQTPSGSYSLLAHSTESDSLIVDGIEVPFDAGSNALRGTAYERGVYALKDGRLPYLLLSICTVVLLGVGSVVLWGRWQHIKDQTDGSTSTG